MTRMTKTNRLLLFFFVSLVGLSTVAAFVFVVLNRTKLEQLIVNTASYAEHVTDPSSVKAPRILFVGNSLTFFFLSPNTVAKFAESLASERPQVSQLMSPGVSLEDHYKMGRYQKLLQEQKFDYVVLQEQFQRSLNETSLAVDYGQKMATLARKAGSKVLLFEVWAARDQVATQEKLSTNSTIVASKIGAPLIKVGDAFFRMAAKHPEIDLYDQDGHHPSKYGSYLASCMLFRSLYQRASLGAPNKIDYDFGPLKVPVFVVTPDEAAKLQKCADSISFQ